MPKRTEYFIPSKKEVLEHTFKIYFYSRSLNSNLAGIKHCLNELERKFTVIARSETWLDDEQIDAIGIEGYEFFSVHRTQSKGGGLHYSLIKCINVKLSVISHL